LKAATIKQKGSMMLEGLIAILIFSLGILSIVALLGASVKNTSDAKYRTEASLLTNQIIGQMWTGDRTSTALVADYSSPDGTAFTAWSNAVTQTLPGVTGANMPTVEITGNVVTVTVRWQAPGEAASHNYVAIARING
jgi:type IV pilus assembly protein PilV